MTGIESYADFYLRGQNGWVETEKDGRRQELPQFRTRDVPAVDGYSVTLSIDSTVQHIVDAELDYIGKKYQPLRATIIVSDPRTGFILGMGNYPTFNLNEYNKVGRERQDALRDVAVADEYEPGSVFKIIPVAAALNEGLVTPQTKFDCSLATVVYNDNGSVHTLKLPREDASDHFVHPLTVAQILGRSSNKGAAQLGMMLGRQRLYAYARAFGIGDLSGLPVGSEIRGSFAPPDKWNALTITRVPMGQGVALTPIQMHEAMSVIASGGVLLRPQLIREVRDAQGAIVYWFRPSEVRRVIRKDTADTMRRLLATVATPPSGEADGGMGAALAIPGFEVAGKTGTAQKTEEVTLPSGKKVRRYSTHHHVGSFVGFFPARNPQVVISVIVDDADAHAIGGTGYGVQVAGPSFVHIGTQLISYLDIRPADAPAHAPLAMGGSFP
jgi:cell division protein FtsI/penicillin-binding protein 2